MRGRGTPAGLARGTSALVRRLMGAASPALLARIDLARRRGRYLREPTRGPKRILLEPTTGCNHRCLMCIEHSVLTTAPARSAQMPFELLDRLIRDMAAMGVESVWLAGRGEPLLHPQARQLFESMGSLGLSSELTTNGRLLTEEFAARLCDTGLRQLSVSIDSGDAETYAKVHQTRADDRARILGVVKGVSHRSPRPKLLMSMVISRPNRLEIAGFVRDAIDAGVDAVVIGGMRPVSFDTSDLALSDGDWAQVRADLEVARETTRRAGVELWTDNIRPAQKPQGPAPWPYERMACFIAHTFAVIDVDGSVHGCCTCQNRLGLLTESSFPEIWHSRAYRVYRRTLRELPVTGRTPPMCDCRYGCGHIPENVALQQELGYTFAQRTGGSEYATRLDLIHVLGERLGQRLPSATGAAAFADLESADERTRRGAARLRDLGVVKGTGSLDGRPVFDPTRMVARTELEEILSRVLSLTGIPADRSQTIIAESRVGSAAETEPLKKRELESWVDGVAKRAG